MLNYKVLGISTPTMCYTHLYSNLTDPAEQEMGISLAHVAQQPINTLHLAVTQIAFFRCQCATHLLGNCSEELSAWKGSLCRVDSRDYQCTLVFVFSSDETERDISAQ